LGARVEAELGLSHHIRKAEAESAVRARLGTDWTRWGASAWIRYHLTRDVSTAVGFASGYDEVADAPDMSHSQPQIQVRWEVTTKLFLTAETGLERRRTRTIEGRTEENLRYSGSLRYTPTPTSTLLLNLGRAVEPSYFDRLTTQSEWWDVGAQQRFFRRITVSAGSSHRRSDYDSVTRAADTLRDDRYTSWYLRVSTTLFRRTSASISYQHGRNRSSEAVYSFTSDQFGAQAAYRF
jgi:hypothetical protein